MAGNKLPSLFKSNSAKRFNFKPRYYNEIKERVEQQERRVLKEMEFEKKLESEPELRLREQMKTKWKVSSRKEASQKANRRVLIIATVLGLVAYYILLRE
jgi:hypothetical protein